jgi:predicted Zn-dependent peptidase
MIFFKVYIGALCLVFAGLATSFGQTTHQWKQATAGGYTYKYVTGDPMHARFYHLKNGLTVILSVNKKEPRIQTLIGVRTGSNNDPKDHTGLAHYLEHLLFKGTDKYGSLNWEKEKPYIDEITNLYDVYNNTTDPARRKAIYHQVDSVSGIAAKYAIPNEYMKLMSGLGSQGTNAHTSVEETVFEENIPSSSIDKYLAIEAERYRLPVFRLFHTELEAVYEEKNRGLDNDGRKVYETMLAAVFPTHNYGQQTTIGTVEHLKNPSLNAIRNYYNKWYVPNNMTIVMAGDFDPAYVIKKIDADFSYMRPKPLREYKPAPELPIQSPITKEVLGPDAENVNIAFRMPGALDSHAKVLLEVLTDMLSNGKAGLIDLNLNQPQKVLSAMAYDQPFKDYSVLVLSGKAKQGQQLDEVKDLMLAQIERIRKGDFDPALLKAVVSNARLANMQGLDDNNNRATTLMNAFIKHKGDNWLDDVDFEDDMAKVTKPELIAFVNKYLNNNYAVVYKRKGIDNSIVKVEKPAITPITINRDVQSVFFKEIALMPSTPVHPQWLDFKKDMQTGKIGPADFYYVQNKDNSLFNLYYRFDLGTSNNKYLKFANQYLQFLGTDKRSSETINKAFYNIACSYSINITKDVTTVTITGLQENFDQAVSLFEDLMRNCKPDETALSNLKGDIQKSRENFKLNKGAIMQGMITYAMYGEHNPFNYQLSKVELNALTSVQLKDILHTLLDNKHSVIYYGPLSVANAQAAITKLHSLPSHFVEVQTPVKFEKTTQTANQVLFANYDMVQSEVYWIRNTGNYDSESKPTLDVFNSYFGGGIGSVVFQTLRESKALAYSTFAQYVSPDKKDGRYSMVAYIGSQADKMNEAISGMNDLLTAMPETDQLFDAAKQGIKQDIATGRITKDDIVFNYLSAQRLGLDYDIRKQEYDALDKLSFESIRKFHDQNLKGVPYTYCILGSEKKITPEELAKYGEVKTLTLEEIFGY